jgi:RND family efflux transporter MFP subunit
MRIAALLLVFVAVAPGTAALAEESAPLQSASLGELSASTSQQLSASVVPRHDSTLAAEIAAVVAAVEVEVGARVEPGAVLLRLDARDATLQRDQVQAQRQAAAARADLAGRRRQRGEELAPQGHISADELLALRAADAAAEADLALAEAALALAKRQLDKTVLRAPFAGEVLARQAQVGAMASPGQPLLRLIGVDGEVEAALPAELAARFERGSGYRFHYAGRDYPLTLARLGGVVDPSARTRIARLQFVDAAAPPGSSGQLRWREPGHAVPAELLVERDGRLGVFLVDAGVARFHALPEALPGRGASVDLPSTTRIVIRGQQSLQDGMAVAADGTP